MKLKIMLSVAAMLVLMNVLSQRSILELTFTAINNTSYVQLDSIKVKNCTKGCDTVLYWPDTVLSINIVGVHERLLEQSLFKVYPGYPNPTRDNTSISLYVPKRDHVSIIVTDNTGKLLIRKKLMLDQGKHSFWLNPGAGNQFFFTAHWQGQSSSIKIIKAAAESYHETSLEYLGIESINTQLKSANYDPGFLFDLGDNLYYIGYADTLRSGWLDIPEASDTCTFQFATNIPCPGSPTVEYEGQVYNTVQIFSQCWLKENLNVGEWIHTSQFQANNGIIEKHCYDNSYENCNIYGGLYQWNEMMQYTTAQGTQGICPSGWHLPTDEEWKILEGAADSQYGIGDLEWNYEGFRGFDAGTNLRATNGWGYNGNGTDAFGFTGLPGGKRGVQGYCYGLGVSGSWWTSTDNSDVSAYLRSLKYNNSQPARSPYSKPDGYSVRCIKDN